MKNGKRIETARRITDTTCWLAVLIGVEMIEEGVTTVSLFIFVFVFIQIPI